MRSWSGALAGLLGAAGIALSAGSAQALPALQMFIEHVPSSGNTTQWDGAAASDPETWAAIGQNSFRLWIFGDTSKAGSMFDLRFVSSYDSNLVLSVTPSNILAFSSSTTGGAGGYTDPSTPTAPSYLGPVQTGHHPVLSPHGMFDNDPPGDRSWFEWSLGDMTLTDSPLGNTQPGAPLVLGPGDPPWYPPISGGDSGQINVYDMTVTGLPVGAQVHFDVYAAQYGAYECANNQDTLNGTTCTHTERVSAPFTGSGSDKVYYCVPPDVLDGNKCIVTTTYQATRDTTYLNAPYSHDARWEQAGLRIDTPEPLTLGLLGGGLIGLTLLRRRRR